jgi:UDP-glucose 4-epimerase
VLVTGGAGFIGSHLVDALAQAGAEVTVVDDLSSGRRENLEALNGRIRFIEADVRDRSCIQAATRGQEVVFHLAANANVPRSVREPDLDFETNVVGSFNVLRACVEHGARAIVASSAAVYGPPRNARMDEAHPLRPISPYGAAKVAMEELGFAYSAVHGLKFTSIRIFNTFGERQAQYVMVDLLRKLSENPDELEVLGTGGQSRSYCHVSDACRLFLQAAESEQTLGRAVNLTGEQVLDIQELASLLVEMLNLRGRTQIRFSGQSWPGDIENLIGDGGWARRFLSFECRVSLREGLNRLIDWLERHRGWRLRH